MNEVNLMTAAVKGNPADEVAQLVLADAIAEQTGDYERAVSEAKAVVEKVLAKRAAVKLKRLIRGVTVVNLELMLRNANGQRRKRTLTMGNVVNCIRMARKSGGKWYAVGGGTVANSYGYRAYQTACVVAVGTSGKIRVAIGEVNATKGSSLTNPLCGLTVRATDERFRAWADAV